MKFKLSKTWIVIIVIILAVAGYYTARQSFKDPTEGYVLEKVDMGEVVQQISETGNVQATDNISLGFKALGKIASVNVIVGQDVKTGQVLASLDVNQLSQQLKNYEAALDVAKAQYQKLLSGNTNEDVNVYQDIKAQAEQSLANSYSSAVTALNDTYTKSYVAYNAVIDLENDYFALVDQQGIRINNNKNKIKGNTQIIEDLLSQVKSDPLRDNIDNAIDKAILAVGEIGSSLEEIRGIVDEGIYYFDVSSADKTTINTQKTSIDTALTSITNVKEDVAGSKISLQKAESDLALRKSGPRQEDIDVYLAQIRQAEANVNLYQAQVNDSYLRSPIEGKITAVNYREWEVVGASQAVVNLLSSNPFQIKANIYEQDIVNVKIDDPVEVVLIAFSKKSVMGKVVAIDPAEKIVDQVVYYEVTIDFPNEMEGIRSGMTADIVIETNKKENVLRVPGSIVENIDGKEIVQVANNKKIEDREIKTGLEGNDYYEVISGLSKGDEIVIGKR